MDDVVKKLTTLLEEISSLQIDSSSTGALQGSIAKSKMITCTVADVHCTTGLM